MRGLTSRFFRQPTAMTEEVLKEAFEKHVGAPVERVDLDPRKVSGLR